MLQQTRTPKRKVAPPFSAARLVVFATCVLLLGCATILILGKSGSVRSVEVQQSQRQQGTLLIVSDEGSTCRQMSFDNRTGHIVSVHRGPCRDIATSQSQDVLDPDTPLGSIRKALNSK